MNKHVDQYIAAVLVLLGCFVVLWLVPHKVTVSAQAKYIGTETLPKFVAILFTILSCIYFLSSYMSNRKLDKTEKRLSSAEKKQYLNSIIYLGVTLAYIIGINTLGFYGSTLIVLGFLIVWLGGRNKVTVISVSVVTSLVLYAVFEKIFYITFPRGILF